MKCRYCGQNIGNDVDKFFRANVQDKSYRKTRHHFRWYTLRVLRTRNKNIGEHAYHHPWAAVYSFTDGEASVAVVERWTGIAPYQNFFAC